MKNNQKGFSLIELIVVMTIIAVITVAGVVSYTRANAKSRDSRRVGDLEKMRVALEMVKQVGGTYPVNTGSTNAPSQLVPSYIQALPDDPKAGYGYYYVGTAYTYTLDAYMEDVGSTNGTYGTQCGGRCNYRVTSP